MGRIFGRKATGGRGRNKLRRLRDADRHLERAEQFERMARAHMKRPAEQRDPNLRARYQKRKPPICPLCSDVQVYVVKGYHLAMCAHCWHKAGRPDYEASVALAEAAKSKRAAELQAERDSEERPW